jgi:hypothetical protein
MGHHAHGVESPRSLNQEKESVSGIEMQGPPEIKELPVHETIPA